MDLNTTLLISFFILLLFGSLLHFTHNWFKKGILLHIFSSLNESTWEHMKLLIAPTCIVIIFQYFSLRESFPNIFFPCLILLVTQLLTIPLLYETLRLIIKEVPFLITISIFILSIILGIFAEYLILRNELFLINELISLLLIILIFLQFALYSYSPPKMFLFKDPLTEKYGDIGK